MVSIARARMIGNVVVVAGLASAFLVLIVSLIWIFQERIAFQPPRGPWPDAPAARRVEYVAHNGRSLFAYVVGEARPVHGLLLSFHGNADLAVWQIGWAEEVVRRTGVTVMLTEYRGYMGLKGRPTYKGSQLDAEAAYVFARNNLEVPEERIAFFGHSLGSAIATELATRHPPPALLLQSPFTSTRDMAGRMTGYQPSRFLWKLISRLHFDTGAKVARIQAPVSVAHGEVDRLIPAHMGETVFKEAGIKGQWLLVPTAAHNDVASQGGEAYWNWITEALRSISTETPR